MNAILPEEVRHQPLDKGPCKLRIAFSPCGNRQTISIEMHNQKFFFIIAIFSVFLSSFAHAIGTPAKLPNLSGSGITGSAGAGFTDFDIISPSASFKMDRGTYVAVQIERGFNLAHLYFTLTLSQMSATGVANYNYTNLGGATTYTASNVDFNASLLDLGLGFKFKLIEDYWFRPYIEGGGVGSYYQIAYTSKLDVIDAQGPDGKKTDVVMGSGYYGEAGIEVEFAQSVGIKFAARYGEQQSKPLETQGNNTLKYRAETYYLSALVGF